MKTAAIYTRVSSDHQKENKTIASQVDALLDFAEGQQYIVPKEYVFRDEGYSGATLVRPGLEKLRDLSAEGHIQAVLIYSPDRLSRNYAYQVVLMEEFVSCGTEVLYVTSPKAETPEETLLLQFQGMMAEYERALIKERTRRGKRFKAKAGIVNVLSGAPYGYNYIKKTQETAAWYEINEEQALVVREVFRSYTEDFLSIGAITKELNARKTPTKKRASKWERSAVWGMLSNPAYCGKACYGKSEKAVRQKFTKPYRDKNGYVAPNGCTKKKPREEWIEIPVPPIINEPVFDAVQEILKKNKLQSQRNTIVETLLQGMMVCGECGYAMYRTATYTKPAKKKIYYYRCYGADAHRFDGVRKCSCRSVRQDYLDNIVWLQIVTLLEDPALIQREVEKRVEDTRKASPVVEQKAVIESQRAKLLQATDKLLDAYQEGLITIDQLRKRMPELQKRINTTEKELEHLKTNELALDQRLQLLDVESFKKQLGENVNQLDIQVKKKILKLLVKQVIVGNEMIEIKHSISLKKNNSEQEHNSLLLCTRSHNDDAHSCFFVRTILLNTKYPRVLNCNLIS
jgi:site-specific DNA recombinase